MTKAKLLLFILFLGLASSVHAFDKIVTPEEAVVSALKVGAKMPAFELSDSDGKKVSSESLLKKGNLVLVFYRGAWCPFCNVYLKKLQDNLQMIRENGGELVAVSVENPDNSAKIASKNKLNFTVLSDPLLKVAKEFGIVFELAPTTNEQYKGYGIDLVKNNGTAKPELPLSATYIINPQGEIIYAFLDPDYKKRAEPQEIINELKKAAIK